jgi:hypothetical protein
LFFWWNCWVLAYSFWALESFVQEFCFFFNIWFVFLKTHLFTCAYIVLVTSPPCLPLAPSPSFPSQFQAGPVLPLSLILLKERDKPNKEDKAFLLVELRIAIQKDS